MVMMMMIKTTIVRAPYLVIGCFTEKNDGNHQLSGLTAQNYRQWLYSILNHKRYTHDNIDNIE